MMDFCYRSYNIWSGVHQRRRNNFGVTQCIMAGKLLRSESFGDLER